MAANAIATAISEGFKLVSKVMSGSEGRRVSKAIELGERFILLHYDTKVPQGKKVKQLEGIRKAFFKVNN